MKLHEAILQESEETNHTPDYKSMYFSLFNSVTDAIDLLKAAQIKAEQMYIESE